jgi:PAB-dependent poly(A)-specific ribonuclease subunit 2
MDYAPLQLVSPLPVTGFGAVPYATALAFDPYADLLHVGSSAGSVTSLCSPLALDRYVYYGAHGAVGFGPFSSKHLGSPAGVHAIRITEKEVRTLTEGGLGARRRNGVGKWKIEWVALQKPPEWSLHLANF